MSYSVAFEVAGPLAMFTRPDTGAAPTSYPAPTWSVCKGLFESIAFLSDRAAWFVPTRVEICRPLGSPGGVRYQKYATNYGGPLRKSQVIEKHANMQLFATALADVCYRIYARVDGPRATGGQNARHHLQDMFHRRIRQGGCFQTPALGWKEFTCSYWGAFRAEYEVDKSIDLTIGSMSVSPWDTHEPRPARRFNQNVRVVKGVLTFC